MKRVLLCLLLSVGLLALNVNMVILCIVSPDLLTLAIAVIVAAATVFILYKGVHRLAYISRDRLNT